MKILVFLLIVSVVFGGCLNRFEVQKSNNPSSSILEMSIPNGFSFETFQRVDIELSGSLISGREIQIFDKKPGAKVEPIATLVTKKNTLSTNVRAENVKSLFVKSSDGVIPETEIDVINKKAVAVLGNEKEIKRDDNVQNYTTGIYTKNVTLIFEDKWPQIGDYDFNDAVILCREKATIVNNYLSEIRIDYNIIAAGANDLNGFALQLNNISSNSITSINAPESNTTLDANSKENALIVITDNIELSEIGQKSMYNTTPDKTPGTPYLSTKWHTITLAFKPGTVVDGANIFDNVFNPFIFKTNDRGREIHKINGAKSIYANQKYDGTGGDKNGKYVTQNGLPWVLEIPGIFYYPKERIDFLESYPDFKNWVEKNGQENAEWYNNYVEEKICKRNFDPVLKSIKITSLPSKLNYFTGDSIDLIGLVVEESYDNGMTINVKVTAENVTGFDTSTAGTKTLTVNINGKTATFQVTVQDIVLSSIAIVSPATKTSYFVGEGLDISGLSVEGTYNNGTKKIETVTANNITGFDSNTAGTKILTVNINGKTATFQITVQDIVLSSIAIVSPATKTSYFVGEGLDITGLSVEGTYNNGTKKIETVTANNITGFDSNTAGTKTLTINIKGKTATYQITVQSRLQSIAIKTPATKTNYFIGEGLDITGLSVEGTYNNGTKKTETVTADNITGFDSNTAGTKTLTVNINGKTATFKVTVQDIVLSSIAIVSPATKTSYFVGESLDLTGLIVEGTYNNGTKKIETVTANNITGFDSNSAGTKTLTINIKGKTTTYQITVQIRPQSLTIKTFPKIWYYLKEALDITGLTVEGTYSDGSKKLETVTVSNITGFDNSKVGVQTLTINIKGITATYSVSVLPRLLSLAIKTLPTKTSYNLGEKFNITGLTVDGTFDDGITRPQYIQENNITGFDSSSPGINHIGVTINGVKAKYYNDWYFNINIVGTTETIGNFVLVPSGTTHPENGFFTVAKDFYISKYETTQSEFQNLMGFNTSSFKGDVANNPVESVTWYDAVAFCNAKSTKDKLQNYYSIKNIKRNSSNNIIYAEVKENGGTGYRIPTSEEIWYASRGGKNGVRYEYSGSNNVDEVAWHYDNSSPDNNPNHRVAHKVGLKKPNTLGIFDMSGNVLEWCGNPIDSFGLCLTRGGSFDMKASWSSVTGNTSSAYPQRAEERSYDVGFRLARTK